MGQAIILTAFVVVNFLFIEIMWGLKEVAHKIKRKYNRTSTVVKMRSKPISKKLKVA